nr:hypothetical protein [Candidatus Kuenenia stuttgartiensis]
MSRFVEKGIIDAGLTGADWVKEAGSDVKVVVNLVYAKQQLTKVKWVLAVPEDSEIRSVQDLNNKSIATELVNVTRQYLAEKGLSLILNFLMVQQKQRRLLWLMRS